MCIHEKFLAVLVSLLVFSLGACSQHKHATEHHAETYKVPQATGTVPLYDNLGSHHYEISTTVPGVQDYFDQGLRLYYAFNHAESVLAFKEARRLDPQCAICWWGEAMAWGPNINLPMDAPSGVAAYAAVQGALAVKEHASEQEQALIDALSVRYAAEPTDDRVQLDQTYAASMTRLIAQYPDDQEIAVLYAESLMDLRPWDYWTADGSPKPGIADALAALESVIAVNETHPGACHFFIHAVEKLYPERAVECAERLVGLMPGAGHLVHMPGHIYIRVGRYLDAVKMNKHAIHADESYIRDQNPAMGMYTAGYYPHNYDFLAFAAMMIGRGKDSISAAETVATLLPQELFGAPGMDFLQHWSVRPLLVRIRFARWDELLAVDAPADTQVHAKAIWHYARGRALAAKGDTEAATMELGQLAELASRDRLAGIKMEFNQSVDLLGVAQSVLAGRVDASAGRFETAIAHLEETVKREDALLYGEPPEWTVPTRQDLGDVLLEAGRFSEAEQIFREDLKKFPKNGWSLHGLETALRAQDRTAEAEVVRAEFKLAWATADVDL